MTSVDLDYATCGPEGAPAALFGGSLGTNRAMWGPQLSAFSSNLRMIAFDHRGHGGSPVPKGPYEIAQMGRDVLSLIDGLRLERVFYVGLSIGGMVGQWLAANHPERIERLVLLTTSAYPDPTGAFAERAATVRTAGTTEVIADAVLARWFTARWIESNAQQMAGLREMLCATAAEGYASCCEAISTFDLRAELAQIVAPTLVIGGAQDLAIPPEHQQAIAAGVAAAKLEIIEDAAHLPNIQHPDTVNRLISDHLGVPLA
jgi:3-oxoadipate enol-lactonase